MWSLEIIFGFHWRIKAKSSPMEIGGLKSVSHLDEKRQSLRGQMRTEFEQIHLCFI